MQKNCRNIKTSFAHCKATFVRKMWLPKHFPHIKYDYTQLLGGEIIFGMGWFFFGFAKKMINFAT